MSSPVEERSATDRQFATTLQRGLQILACFDAWEPMLTNKEIAARTGLPRPTVSRLTYTLTSLGYLKHHQHIGKYGKYELGMAVLSLSHPLLANLNVRQLARLPMRLLADYAKGWVSLGTRERLNMVYIETARARDAVDVKPDIGQTFPILVSAMGRAYLAALTVDERIRLLNQFMVGDPELLKRNIDNIQQGYLDYEEKGFCLSLGDYDSHTHAVAVPMRVPNSGDILVFNCAIRTGSLTPIILSEDLGPRLVELVKAIKDVLHD